MAGLRVSWLEGVFLCQPPVVRTGQPCFTWLVNHNTGTQDQGFHVGTDYAIKRDSIVHIYARREIRDWTVREFSRQVIFFRGGKYYLQLREKAASPYAFRYELAPWPDHLHEHSNQSFTYDEALVAERDRAALSLGATSAAHAALLPLYPLLGFFWSGFKERVFCPLGFPSSSITAASTLAEFLFLVVHAIFFGYLGGGILSQLASRELLHPLTHEGSMVVPDLVILLVLSLDSAIRYSQILRGDESPDGFLEWLFRFRRSASPPDSEA